MKNFLGIDIGDSSIKVAVSKGGEFYTFSKTLPDNLVNTEGLIVSPEAMADVIYDMLREHHIKVKDCALVLPNNRSYTRRVTMPYMTVDQLAINLPYEFNDYTQKDKDAYFYDYAVVDVEKNEEGEENTLDLLACISLKETINERREMLKKAGLKLKSAVPVLFTYQNIIREYEAEHEEHPKEYCIIDMGYRAICIYIYRNGFFENTRTLEYGGASMDALIADYFKTDVHIASEYKALNHNNALDLDVCKDLYSKIAVEIMRAVNFYAFNNPQSELHDAYFCGGLSQIPQLMETIKSTVDINIHNISDLLGDCVEQNEAMLFASAIGVTMQ